MSILILEAVRAAIRSIGLPACIIIALLVFYEGIPGASRIPFLSSIPVIGDLTTGRVSAYAAQQVKLATAGLVAKSQVAALKAQLTEEQRRREAVQTALRNAQDRALEADQRRAIAESNLAAKIAADKGGDGAVWKPEDLQWLKKN